MKTTIDNGRAMLLLRAIEPEDIEFLFKTENDEAAWDVSANHAPMSRHLLIKYIANTLSDVYAERELRLVIEHIDAEGSHTVVGIIDITSFDPQHLRAELGVVIAPEHRRHGYATEAVTLMTNYCASQLHLHQLYVIVPEDNEASLHTFHKCGFFDTATLKDWLFDGEKYKNARLLQKNM